MSAHDRFKNSGESGAWAIKVEPDPATANDNERCNNDVCGRAAGYRVELGGWNVWLCDECLRALVEAACLVLPITMEA